MADPPYAADRALERVLDVLGDPASPLEAAGVVVCKHHWRWEGPDVSGRLVGERSRRFGETALTWYRVADP